MRPENAFPKVGVTGTQHTGRECHPQSPESQTPTFVDCRVRQAGLAHSLPSTARSGYGSLELPEGSVDGVSEAGLGGSPDLPSGPCFSISSRAARLCHPTLQPHTLV